MRDIGKMEPPADFPYEALMKKGRTVHRGDYFAAVHPKMDLGKRAKIFAPFAALKGFEEEVESKEVRYETKRELDTEELEDLNEKLQHLQELTYNTHEARKNCVRADIECFVPCNAETNQAYQNEGSYQVISGMVWQVDKTEQRIRIDDRYIAFEDIYRIEFGKGNEHGHKAIR